MPGRAAADRLPYANQTVPVIAVVGSPLRSLSSSSFSPCSWDCSEFATGSLISKAMADPSLKSFKLSANNPLLKLLARKLGWDRAWLTTPRFCFCSQMVTSKVLFLFPDGHLQGFVFVPRRSPPGPVFAWRWRLPPPSLWSDGWLACAWPAVTYPRCKNIQVLNYLMTGSQRVTLFEVAGEGLLLRVNAAEVSPLRGASCPTGQHVLALLLVCVSWTCSWR